MHTNFLIAVTAAVVVLWLLRSLGANLLRRWYPTAGEPFPSIKDFAACYLRAFRFIWKHKWVVWIPACLALVQIVLSRTLQVGAYNLYINALEHEILWTEERVEMLFGEMKLGFYVNKYVNAMGALAYGYTDAWIRNAAFALFCLIVIVFHPLFLRKLEEKLGGMSNDGLIFAKRVFKPFYAVAIVALVVGVVAYICLSEFALVEMTWEHFVLAVVFLLLVHMAYIVSFAESLLLLVTGARFRGEVADSKGILLKTLDVARPLFKLNLLVAIPGFLVVVFNMLRWYPVYEVYVVLSYASPVLIVLTLSLPFEVAARGGGDLRDAIRGNLKVLASGFARHYAFVICGGVILFGVSLADWFTSKYALICAIKVHPYVGLCVNYACDLAFLAASVLFFIAYYRLYCDDREWVVGSAPPPEPQGVEQQGEG